MSSATGVRSTIVDDDDDGVDDLSEAGETDDNNLTAGEERANVDDQVTFSYAVTVTAADLYAALRDSGKGMITIGSIIAIGVSTTAKAADRVDLPTVGGVGLVSQPFMVTIEK